MLGTSLPQFVPAQSRAHKGAGVEFHLTVPSEDIEAVHEAHRWHAESVTQPCPAAMRGAGVPRDAARLRFLIAAERADQGEPPSGTTN